jgi:hypothetical protein
MELKQFTFRAVDEDGNSTSITVISDSEDNAKAIAQDQAKWYGMKIA